MYIKSSADVLKNTWLTMSTLSPIEQLLNNVENIEANGEIAHCEK